MSKRRDGNNKRRGNPVRHIDMKRLMETPPGNDRPMSPSVISHITKRRGGPVVVLPELKDPRI